MADTVRIDDIVIVGDNVRHDIGDVSELAASIRRFGILQPVLVCPRNGQLLLVAGHRRMAAARVAGLTEVPVVYRELDDSERSEAMLTENIHRQDLNALEKAQAYKKLIEARGWSQQQLADALGLSQTTIANGLMFLRLRKSQQKLVIEGRMGLQRALDLYVRKHKPGYSPRQPHPSEVAVSRVYVVVGLTGGKSPPEVKVFADDEMARDVRQQMANEGLRPFTFPCNVDRTKARLDLSRFEGPRKQR